jgi:hypothetical protein
LLSEYPYFAVFRYKSRILGTNFLFNSSSVFPALAQIEVVVSEISKWLFHRIRGSAACIPHVYGNFDLAAQGVAAVVQDEACILQDSRAVQFS